MKLSGNNKIILLGLILLIVAGIVVVVLKGFNLPIGYQKHESINFKIGNNVDFEKADEICKSVFGDKKYELRELELFDDSISVSAQDFSDEEKQNLVEKLNAEFGTEFVVPKEKKEETENQNAVSSETAETATETGAETTEAPAAETSTTETAATETESTAAESTDAKASEETTGKEIEVVKIPNYRLRDMVRIYIKPVLIVSALTVIYMLIRFMRIKPFVKVAKLAGILALLELAALSVIAITRLPVSPLVINVLAGFALVIVVFYLGKLEDELKNTEKNS